MEINKVKVTNCQGVILEGKYARCNDETCVMFVHGLAGAFDNIAQTIAKLCSDNGISFLWSGTQSRNINKELLKVVNSEITSIPGGAAYENFYNTMPDLDAWADFLYKENYKKIIFVGHCYGCNKLVYYLSNHNLEKCEGCVFISPSDSGNLYLDIKHEGLLEEAITNVKANQKNKFLSKLIYGFCDMTSAAYIRFVFNPYLNNIPFKNPNGNFKMLNSINKPIVSIIGTNDKALDNCSFEEAEKSLKNICNNCKIGKYIVIKDAKHSFKGFEDDLYEATKKSLNYIQNYDLRKSDNKGLQI